MRGAGGGAAWWAIEARAAAMQVRREWGRGGERGGWRGGRRCIAVWGRGVSGFFLGGEREGVCES